MNVSTKNKFFKIKKMKVFNLFLLLNLGIFSVFSQNNNDAFFSYYNLLSTSLYPNFKIKEKLKDIGVDNLNSVTNEVSFGIDFKVKHVGLNLALGIGGMQNKNVVTRLMVSNLGVGCYFMLKDGSFLTLGGNIHYHLMSINTYIKKGNLNFLTNSLMNSTSFSISTTQFMIGPIIRFEQNQCVFSLGYEFGIVPTYWKSNDMLIINNYKERFDRIHFDIGFKFLYNNFKIK